MRCYLFQRADETCLLVPDTVLLLREKPMLALKVEEDQGDSGML